MEVKFSNVSKEGRKALVNAVSEAAGRKAVYLGAPGFAFAVGDYVIDRHGTLVCDGRAGAEGIRGLLTGLAERGFSFEGDIDGIAPVASGRPEPAADSRTDRDGVPGGRDGEYGGEESGDAAISRPDGDSGKLAIHMPLSGFTAVALDNLENLVAAKAWILKRMAGAGALPIGRDGRRLRFPWFRPDASAVEIDAYSRLIAGMCETAKTKKRVTSVERRPRDGENEKFKARCFLLSIGFIGEGHKQARKILLSPFSGSGSRKAGGGGKAASEAATTAGVGDEIPEVVRVRRDGSGANAGNGDYRDCLACGHSMSEPAGTDGEFDRLFCAERREYVEDGGHCEDFNS